jgi:hypothetical protein
MKKLIFSVVAGLVLCTAGFTGYKIYDNNQMSKYSPLMLKNLEVLSQTEQPNLDDCVEDPDCVCEALHPTDPSKDESKAEHRW